MPEIRYYTVIQEREVKVAASSTIDAANLADRIFEGAKKPDDQINILKEVRIRALDVREDY